MDAKQIAARLMIEAHVHSDELPELHAPSVRSDVQERLAHIGFELVEPVHGKHYSVRPAHREDDALMPMATNFGLNQQEAAMLVIFWCKLAYPLRVSGHPGPHSVQPETIRREFAATFGGEKQASAAMTRLENLEFVRKENGAYVAGPALESMIDASKMVDFVNRRAILVEARDRILKMMDDRKLGPREVVLEYLKSTDDWVFPRDVTAQLGLQKEAVSAALVELHKEGKLEVDGHGRSRKYRRTT